jgi:hypothetical protein
LISRDLRAAARLEEIPDALFRLIDPGFDEAGARDVALFFADVMRLTRGAACVLLLRFRELSLGIKSSVLFTQEAC